MRGALPGLGQMALMAAIVATMLYWPIGIVLGLLLTLAGISFQALVTFGGGMHPVLGMAAWWLIAFLLALIYSALAFPWDMLQDFRSK